MPSLDHNAWVALKQRRADGSNYGGERQLSPFASELIKKLNKSDTHLATVCTWPYRVI